MIAAAIQALQQGFTIHPVKPNDKVPIIEWGQLATRHPQTVWQWWQRWPQANPAVACKPSGLLVVDCDTPKTGVELDGTPYEELYRQRAYGQEPDGRDVLAAFCERAAVQLPVTYTVRTGRGGAHYYYQWPEHVKASQGSPLPLVDVRSNGGDKGGYVLAAGSVVDGKPYTIESQAPIAPAPPWLRELCRDRPPPPRPPRQAYDGPASFGGLANTVAGTPEGQRVFALHWAANRMIDDGAGLQEAEDILIPAAQQAGLDEREARGVVERTYRKRGNS